MKTAFDLIAYGVTAAAFLTFAKWGIDSSDRSRVFLRLLRSHMRREARSRRMGRETAQGDISPYVGLAAFAALPFLLLLFVAALFYQLGYNN